MMVMIIIVFGVVTDQYRYYIFNILTLHIFHLLIIMLVYYRRRYMYTLLPCTHIFDYRISLYSIMRKSTHLEVFLE